MLTCDLMTGQTLPDTLLARYNAAHTASDKGRIISDFLYNVPGDPNRQMGKNLEIMQWFKSRNDSIGVDYTELQIARILERGSDYTGALKHAFPVLSRFERRNDLYGIMRSLNAIGNALENSQNIDQGIIYYKKILPIALSMGDKNHYAYALNNIGAAYAKARQSDSALLYAQRAVNMAKETTDPTFITYAISSLGESYEAQGDHGIARPFLRKGLEYAKLQTDDFALCYACNDLAGSFLATGESDSARYYAHQAILFSRLGDFRDQTLRAYEYLFRSFEKSNIPDSINRYFRLAMVTKDTLFSMEKNRSIQAMGFREQIRQMEMETEKANALEERKNNIQYVGIAIGLIIFLSLFMLLSQSVVVNEKWISFIGVMGLLVLFEFINLLIHPFLASITHHSPVYMLLILVGIASFLIPIHHRIEKWIKEKVVAKNKRIRLNAARKTIEKLENN